MPPRLQSTLRHQVCQCLQHGQLDAAEILFKDLHDKTNFLFYFSYLCEQDKAEAGKFLFIQMWNNGGDQTKLTCVLHDSFIHCCHYRKYKSAAMMMKLSAAIMKPHNGRLTMDGHTPVIDGIAYPTIYKFLKTWWNNINAHTPLFEEPTQQHER